ncbi:MAG TPA: S8 family serine peptidase, partial [Pyrinomonadaceae bacterium]|nr:S8 family serine peptidase [Pyrinomonadaceae bacterium]
MNIFKKIIKGFGATLMIAAVCAIFSSSVFASKIGPKLASQIQSLANDASVGVVVVSFNGSGLTTTHLNILRSVGITSGVTYQNLGMVGVVLNDGQVRALASNSAVRSIWSNDQLQYYMNQARVLTGVEKLRTDAGLTLRNGGMPVSGNGDFSVFVIDSGIDATHADLPLGTKVIQNTSRVVSSTTGDTGITVGGVLLNGFTPSLSIENIPNNDNVGHGTHCAGIVGGLGTRSGGTYAGVAPGVKIVGSGGGAVIFVINALAGWEYGLVNQDRYKIRVVTNSYGPSEPEDYDPDNPFVIASKIYHDRNITVLWAASNDGAEDAISAYGQSPWVITVAAGSKDGQLAGFSSRGVPRERRYSDNNPNNDNEFPTITAPGTGLAFESSLSRFGFTSAIVSVRSSTNLTANGLTDDTEIPVGMIPFYTQISGTSMATPFTAGVVALMLDADPTLSPDEIKQILIDTASVMPGYQDYEVGAGYINAFAAVDKVYNRTRSYANFQDVTFNATLGYNNPAAQPFHIDFDPTVSGPDSTNARPFTVETNVNRLTVRATVDVAGEPGATNLVGIKLYAPDGTVYAPGFALGTSNLREVTVDLPMAGTWKVEARGTRGLSTVPVTSPTAVAAPGPVDGNVFQTRYVVPYIADIQGDPLQSLIEAAIRQRLIDTYPDGTFRPNSAVTREDLARSLALNTNLRQALGSTPKFADVSGDLGRIAEAVTAKGSTLRDYDFVPAGMMSYSGTSFNPLGTVNRLDLAVALVKATGHDAEARALANTNITSGGTTLSDSSQIPGALRGYVQIALNIGLFEAFPAEVIQIAPGVYQAIPGPRFEPTTTVTRAKLAQKLVSFRQLFTT